MTDRLTEAKLQEALALGKHVQSLGREDRLMPDDCQTCAAFLSTAPTGWPAAARELLEARELLRQVVAATVPDDPWCMVPKAWLEKARAALGEKP